MASKVMIALNTLAATGVLAVGGLLVQNHLKNQKLTPAQREAQTLAAYQPRLDYCEAQANQAAGDYNQARHGVQAACLDMQPGIGPEMVPLRFWPAQALQACGLMPAHVKANTEGRLMPRLICN